jgi:hypothetical protein
MTTLEQKTHLKCYCESSNNKHLFESTYVNKLNIPPNSPYFDLNLERVYFYVQIEKIRDESKANIYYSYYSLHCPKCNEIKEKNCEQIYSYTKLSVESPVTNTTCYCQHKEQVLFNLNSVVSIKLINQLPSSIYFYPKITIINFPGLKMFDIIAVSVYYSHYLSNCSTCKTFKEDNCNKIFSIIKTPKEIELKPIIKYCFYCDQHNTSPKYANYKDSYTNLTYNIPKISKDYSYPKIYMNNDIIYNENMDAININVYKYYALDCAECLKRKETSHGKDVVLMPNF